MGKIASFRRKAIPWILVCSAWNRGAGLRQRALRIVGRDVRRRIGSGSGGGAGAHSWRNPRCVRKPWEIKIRTRFGQSEEATAAMETVEVTAAAPQVETDAIRSTSSYAVVMENKDVKEKVDEIAKPIEQNYQSLIKQLRDRSGRVVVAVNGHIIWADVFASTELLEKYWPKLCARMRQKRW